MGGRPLMSFLLSIPRRLARMFSVLVEVIHDFFTEPDDH
jgi:hypothetical protein